MSAITAAEARAVEATAAVAREFLTFRLGPEEYGIDILKVQEIRSYEPPTRIANAPDFIKGVVNLRGVIVPIIDLRMKFALEENRYDQFTVVIILNIAQRTIGVVVDAVSDVLELRSAQIKPAPSFGNCSDHEFITGLASIASGQTERTLILVDIERLLAGADMGLFSSSLD